MSLSAHKLKIALASGAAVIAVAALTHPWNDAATANTPAPAAPPPAEVGVAPVAEQAVADWQSYSGRLEAVEQVEIRPQVAGAIVAIHFKNGGLVHKGDVLFTIDPRPYQAAVDHAQAQVQASQAQVAYTTSDLERAKRLLGGNAISQREVDSREDAAREAVANLAAAKAQLETARINLGFTQVTAPVSGRVSRAEITLGNVVAAGATQTPLTTLVSVSPIYANFDVDEQTYLNYVASVRDGHDVPVRLGLANEDGYSRTGVVEHVDNHLDPVSGTIRVRARFDNADGTLVPGLYARIQVQGSTPHKALLVDDRAIGTDQDKKFVLVVGPDNHVAYRAVTLGALQNGKRVITAGLQAGESVVVNGTQWARPGAQVKPVAVGDAGTPAPQTGKGG